MKKRMWVLLLVVGLLLLQSGCFWNRKTVKVGGQTVVVDSALPESSLNPEDFTWQEDGTIDYTGGRYLTGIDVSSHQGKINWKKVSKQVDFAMIRGGYRGYTEGTLARDTAFRYNIGHALKNGLKVGVYFFSQALNPEEAAEEARYLLKLIRKYDVTLNVAYDWEYIENVEPGSARTEQVTRETVTQCAAAFCETVAAAGYTPAIYCNGMLGYLSYDLSQLPDVEIWYADFDNVSPDFAYRIRMWQYTDAGTLPGVEGKVDYNLCFLDQEPEEDSPSA